MLAVTSATRSTLAPDVPTIAETGLPGFEAVLLYGLAAPAGTPRPIIERLNQALRAALANEDVRKRLAIEGAEAMPGTPEQYAADIDREEKRWSKVVKASGATENERSIRKVPFSRRSHCSHRSDHLPPLVAGASRSNSRTGRSRWWSRCRRAAPTTSWRASSASR